MIIETKMLVVFTEATERGNFCTSVSYTQDEYAKLTQGDLADVGRRLADEFVERVAAQSLVANAEPTPEAIADEMSDIDAKIAELESVKSVRAATLTGLGKTLVDGRLEDVVVRKP